MVSLLTVLGLVTMVLGVSLPPPTGQYNVGYKEYAIPHVSTNDPFWPGGTSTSFLATIFYPTTEEPSSKKVSYLEYVTAILYESNYQFTLGTLSSITRNFLVKDAKPLTTAKSLFPTVIFGPGGGGPPIEVYTSLLPDLASHGYTVIGLDHTYEQPFVRYPNGTGVIGLPILFPLTLELVEAWIPARILDTKALIDYLPTLSKKFGAPINTTSIGVYGHSVGGATAVGALVEDSRIKSAVNVDGTFFGPLGTNTSTVDAKKPILLLGSEFHTGEVDSDESWGIFRRKQTGWWRQLQVDGSLHLDFCDAAFWKTLPPWTASSFGPIEGKRMVTINRALIRDFFDFTLKGKKATLMDGNAKEWPEVKLYMGSNTTAA